MGACPPYLHSLWPSWEFMENFFPFCRSFTSLYYINRKNRVFVNVYFQKFYEILIFSASQSSAQHHSGLAAKGKRLYFLASLEVARELDS